MKLFLSTGARFTFKLFFSEGFYFQPFQTDLWIVVGITLTAAVSVMILTFVVGERGQPVEDGSFNKTEAIFMAFGAICQQGAPNEPKRISTRIAFFMVFILGLVAYASYSAFLTSFLAVKQVQLPFARLSAMYRDTTYKFGTVANTATDTFLRTFPENLVNERYEETKTFEQGIERLLNDDLYAFVWVEASMSYLFHKDCNITTIPNYHLYNAPVSFFVQRNSMYTDLFNYMYTYTTTPRIEIRVWGKKT